MSNEGISKSKPIVKIANIEDEAKESYRWGLINSPYKKDVLLKRGIVWIVFKKPKRTAVGVFSSTDSADKCMTELGPKKHYKRLYYIDVSNYLPEIDKRRIY